MYKLAGEERFLLWAVCSIQLQVRPPPFFSFSKVFRCSVAYSCEDLLQVLCDKSGEKLLLLAEGLLKKHIASHSMHEPEGKFTSPPQMSSQVFLLLMKVWSFFSSHGVYLFAGTTIQIQ